MKRKRMRLSISWRRCKELTETILQLGYQQITRRDLNYLIERDIGADPRTVKKYRKLLEEFDFLRPMHGGLRFQVNAAFLPVQKTLTEVVEEKRR